ncbi:hypothetical protein [Streptomyces sp. NPDC001843]|uniref:hypothetical protein n=1 Tax=Streptomyces sp. NPDC001843 TaxID=3364617 RepID=UPI003690FD1B
MAPSAPVAQSAPAAPSAPVAQSAPVAPVAPVAPAAPSAPVAQTAPAAPSAPAAAPAAQPGNPDLANTDLSGGLSTKFPTVNGHSSLIPSAKDASNTLDKVKPVHGNLWL